MRTELEYTKKLVLVRKLYREGLLSDQEYNKVNRKLMDAYMIIGDSSLFKTPRESDRTVVTI